MQGGRESTAQHAPPTAQDRQHRQKVRLELTPSVRTVLTGHHDICTDQSSRTQHGLLGNLRLQPTSKQRTLVCVPHFSFVTVSY